MPRKPIDEAYLELVANKVVELLDKRESDRKYKAEADAAFFKQVEVAARAEVWRDQQRRLEARQAECQHTNKFTHDFSDSIRRWVHCRDCDKSWKTMQPVPTPKADTELVQAFREEV